jgi:hypothetical protein
VNRSEPERAKVGSPGSRPERGSATATVAPEPNVGCAPPPPPSGEAAGGFLAPGASGPKRPEVVEHAHALLAWAVPAVGKFSRAYRFTLGERIERRLYDLLELLIRATYAAKPEKRALLLEANVTLEVLRHELRIAFGFRLLSQGQLEHATRLADAVGRQVGGWLKRLA